MLGSDVTFQVVSTRTVFTWQELSSTSIYTSILIVVVPNLVSETVPGDVKIFFTQALPLVTVQVTHQEVS